MNAPAPITWRDRVLDAIERAGSSAGEQFLAVVTAGGVSIIGGIAGLPWALALATSAGAFLLSILFTAATFQLTGLPYAADLAVRVVKSFAASLLATVGASQVVDVRTVHWGAALNVAALMAFYTVIKGIFSPNAHLSSSLLPTPTVARIQGVALPPSGYRKAA